MMNVRLIAEQDILTVSGERIGQPSDIVDASIRVGSGVLLPGLINTHDHLHRNHYPRLGSPPYPNAYVWANDLSTRFAPEVSHARSLPRDTALLFGALKNLLGGATTAVHHDRWESAFERDFPIRVPRIRTAHSLRLEHDLASTRSATRDARTPLAMHLAEGTDTLSADEVREADRVGLLDDRFIAVHMVGADADGIRRFRQSGAAVIWCPTSNEFLFGKTVPVELLAADISVLIGTDALLTGTGTILDELKAARGLGMIDDGRLLDGVGPAAARRLGLTKPSLSPGAPADVVLLRTSILDASPRDVALVLVGGMPRLADAGLGEIFDIAGVACEPLVVHGEEKLVAWPLARAAREVFALSPECARIVA
jgi:cytosine/adenosine deaminase-related metal-dependent hydrolase